MRDLKRHVVGPFIITLFAAAGALGAYVYGRAVTVGIAQDRLRRDATQILTAVRAYIDESHTVLDALNASPYPRCSHADLSYARQLIFHAHYLRDAGRMMNGRIACSATLGNGGLPATGFEPDITEADGMKIYRNLPPYRGGAQTVFAFAVGDSFVVRDPGLDENMRLTNLQFTFTVPDAVRHTLGRLSGKSPLLPGAITDRDAEGRVGDALYVSRCLGRYPGCITAILLVPEAIKSNREHPISFAVLGSFAAAFVGLALCLYLRHRGGTVQQLRRAVAKERLRVVYQPIVDMASGRIVGAEALARWTDEEGFSVGPGIFVPLAERHGFAGEITRLVVRQSLYEFASALQSHSSFRLNINATASDLCDPGFLPMLEEATLEAGVPANSVAIEITESATVRGSAAMQTILDLRRRGYGVQIDDFGTGYSSLAYLQDLAVDTIKIDKSFTQAVGTGAASTAILPRILAMANELHLDVIVEGIETDGQARYFRNIGHSLRAQGWYSGQPVAAAELLLSLGEEEAAALVS
jgi:sensor c-di-GMP phosphodiesterase-like protein